MLNIRVGCRHSVPQPWHTSFDCRSNLAGFYPDVPWPHLCSSVGTSINISSSVSLKAKARWAGSPRGGGEGEHMVRVAGNIVEKLVRYLDRLEHDRSALAMMDAPGYKEAAERFRAQFEIAEETGERAASSDDKGPKGKEGN